MKREARILVSASSLGCYAALVLRGPAIDGASVASSCASLCLDLAGQGFLGEARYAVGPCACGLPPPPARPWFLKDFERLALLIAEEAASLATLNTPKAGPCGSAGWRQGDAQGGG